MSVNVPFCFVTMMLSFVSGLFHTFFNTVPFGFVKEIFIAGSMIYSIYIAIILENTFLCSHYKFCHERIAILVLFLRKFKYCFNWFWFRARHCFFIGQIMLANNAIATVYLCFRFLLGAIAISCSISKTKAFFYLRTAVIYIIRVYY